LCVSGHGQTIGIAVGVIIGVLIIIAVIIIVIILLKKKRFHKFFSFFVNSLANGCDVCTLFTDGIYLETVLSAPF